MNKKNLAVKMGIMLAVGMIGIFGAGKVNAEGNGGLRFEGIRDTTIEAKSKFSTIQEIKAYNELGQEKGYSVYYKGKKISSSNYIRTNKVTKKGQYHLLRYELRSGNKVKNTYRKVYVKDTKAPVFSGISNISINYGSKFSTIKNVFARDNIDGKRGYSVYIAKNTRWYKVSKKRYVNTRKSGKYYLKYVVRDKSGNTTIKRRTVTVKAKPVKTANKKKKISTIKTTNTIHIYPKYRNESGWWWQDGDQSRLYIHSAKGENMANIKPGTRLVIHINNTTYSYKVYDKALVWGTTNYRGSSSSKAWHYVTRNGRYAYTDIEKADLYLQTCFDNGWSKILVSLARAEGKAIPRKQLMFVSNPQ